MLAMQHDWIDISTPLQNGMVHWPGDPAFVATRKVDMADGNVCNLTHLDMSAHTGTHMDAPLHFVRDGVSMDAMPLDAVVGPARVVAIDDPVAIQPSELEKFDIRAGERIIFKTRNARRDWHDQPFDEDFVHISADAARYLVERQVKTVGVDYLSIGGYKTDGVECHQVMLGAGVWVIEGLRLNDIEPGDYELVCLPLHLMGAEGAPARAIIRPSHGAKHGVRYD